MDRAETCLGPHPTNDVIIPEPNLPDVAAVLVDRGNHRYFLRSLTHELVSVNGKVIEDDEISLIHDDEISIGQYLLRFRLREKQLLSSGQTKVQESNRRLSVNAQLRYRGQTFELSDDTATNIGAAEDNQIVIQEDFASSYHCRIIQFDQRWEITDLGSTNGTTVNNLRIEKAELPSRATIRVGDASLEFTTQANTPNLSNSEIYRNYGMIGQSSSMKRVFDLITRFAPTDAPVLINGKSGSGKELVARALHDASERKNQPYLALNCGALASTMIEAELFGHVKGAFTGATSDKVGAFESTKNGTLFLDEIGEMPLELQPKLLRVLESRCIRKVGGNRETPINTRIVAATHKNLQELVKKGEFREDLFHRLFVLNIELPALAERPSDIVLLARHFLSDQSPDQSLVLTAAAEEKLSQYSWPGNVRELKNMIFRAVLLRTGNTIDIDDLEFSDTTFFTQTASQRVRAVDGDERDRILQLLKEHGGNRSAVARELGYSKSTFHDKLKRLGIPNKFGASMIL
ncbi:MAG: sigma 54-interacting transcriptional regulator [Myxococcota bacterium]|nr:sigma 54-interacting transcriptional regulator [Myxococcota bacterium]